MFTIAWLRLLEDFNNFLGSHAVSERMKCIITLFYRWNTLKTRKTREKKNTKNVKKSIMFTPDTAWVAVNIIQRSLASLSAISLFFFFISLFFFFSLSEKFENMLLFFFSVRSVGSHGYATDRTVWENIWSSLEWLESLSLSEDLRSVRPYS